MELMELTVMTAIAQSGMTVRQLFQACVDADVPGLPYQDKTGAIAGNASIRHVIKETCIPEFMVQHARLLGDNVDALQVPELKAQRLLALPVEEFILPDIAVVTPLSPIAKALAVMEHHDTTYLFVIDKAGRYHGTISIMSLASHLLKKHK